MVTFWLFIHVMLVSCLLSILPSSIFGQQVDIQIVYNNSLEVDKSTQFITSINSIIKVKELQNALANNHHLSDKNLLIKIAFFDRNVIGTLRLKDEHELTPEEYIDIWQESLQNKNGILFLFIRAKGDEQYNFFKMVPSYALENEFLLPHVSSFINENLNGEYVDIIKNGATFIAKAMTPVWNDNKKNEAIKLANYNKYKRFHFNFLHGYWAGYQVPNLNNLEKIPKVYLNDNITNVWFLNKQNGDTIKPAIPINISAKDTTQTRFVISDNFGNLIETFSTTSIMSDINTNIILIEVSAGTYKLIEFLNEEKLFSESTDLIHWGWKADGSSKYSLASMSGILDYKIGNQYWFFTTNSRDVFDDGDVKPPWIDGYWDTYCNVFASDLSRMILFPGIFIDNDAQASSISYAPWGKHECANEIYTNISDNKNFKKIESSDPVNEWEYTKKGFVVYYVKREVDNGCSPSGHIATCFDGEDQTVIQVGSHRITNPVGKWNDEMKEAYLYLGYITK